MEDTDIVVTPHLINFSLVPITNDFNDFDDFNNEPATDSDANALLKNGILIETQKGIEWRPLAETVTSGVGDLSYSVGHLQNLATQLLHLQTPNSSEGEIETSDSLEPGQCFQIINLVPECDLEAVAEGDQSNEPASLCITLDNSRHEQTIKPAILSKSVARKSILPRTTEFFQGAKKLQGFSTNYGSSSLTFSESTGTNSDSSVQSVSFTQVKKKGGWPKGRKRKPEPANRPPKAPCTGYVYYLSEMRKRPEFAKTPFPEVTKMLGNEWSCLSYDKKKKYLERAETDKKRYRDELKVYRNSDTYQSYLKRRRIRSCKTNGTEESDIDATDGYDDEDNEELYCRACDQWFINLHNKKEHLYGKQHHQMLSQSWKASSSMEESHSDRTNEPVLHSLAKSEMSGVPDAMTSFLHNVAVREQEIYTLQDKLKSSITQNKEMLKRVKELKQSQARLRKLLCYEKEKECKLKKVTNKLLEIQNLSIEFL